MIVFVDGNIGCGKSTLLMELRGKGYDVVDEPIGQWRDFLVRGKSIFHYYYTQKKKFAFTFQLYILLLFRKLVDKHEHKKLVFIERSFGAHMYIFAKYHFEHGNMSEMEMKIYKEFHHYFDRNEHIHLFIDCDPTICLERIQQRNRPEEKHIDFTYISKLHTYHTEYYKELSERNIKFIHVSGIVSVQDVLQNVIEKLPEI